MNILFLSRHDEAFFNTQKKMLGKLGKKMTEKFQRRKLALEAAETLDEYRSAYDSRCHELTGDRKGQIAIDLIQPYRLVIRPVDPPPKKPDGGLDWKSVKTIVILEIVDYH